MKNVLILLTVLFIATQAAAVDFYADAYRFAEDNATERFGIATERYNFTLSYGEQPVSIGSRHYLKFTNLEYGLLTEVSLGQATGAKDYRTAHITDDLWFSYTPYARIGDTIQATLMYDTSDSWLIRVGFKLF